jgi:hypothetical protein
MWPFTASSTGPVKNSPSGMLCSPTQAIQLRPDTPSVMSVPSAWIRTSSRPWIQSVRRRTCSDWRCQAVTGSPSNARQAA